jgi:hypothetical protein
MDPISLDEFLSELRSSSPETTSIPVENLTPGCVISAGQWARYVVTERPTVLGASGTGLVVPVRHLNGGHNLRPQMPRGHWLPVYVYRIQRPTAHDVPVVPRCIVPDAPAIGDRVVLQSHDVGRVGLGVAPSDVFDGKLWNAFSTSGGRTRVTQASTAAIQLYVGTSGSPASSGWHVYLPSGHRPHLYVDGRPTPARTGAELATGDVLLTPGGGRMEVESVTAHADGRSVGLRVLRPSRHLVRNLTWAAQEGDRVEHHDSGRTGYLYATEPRAGELLSAADLYPSDAVIAAWGTPYSAVSVVEQVSRQLMRPTMNVHSSAPDGRRFRTTTGLDNRYYLLHRSAQPSTAEFRPESLAEYAF